MAGVYSDEETSHLIQLWSNIKVQEGLKLTRNKLTYAKLASQMEADGFPKRAIRQLNDKIWNLNRKFFEEKRKVDLSGESATQWPFYGMMNEILGDRPLTSPKHVIDSSEFGEKYEQSSGEEEEEELENGDDECEIVSSQDNSANAATEKEPVLKGRKFVKERNTFMLR